jgi:hypothetical protein
MLSATIGRAVLLRQGPSTLYFLCFGSCAAFCICVLLLLGSAVVCCSISISISSNSGSSGGGGSSSARGIHVSTVVVVLFSVFSRVRIYCLELFVPCSLIKLFIYNTNQIRF